MAKDNIRLMLESIRKMQNGELINEEEEMETGESFPITKDTPQFGDIRTAQEETIRKTIGEAIELDEKALVFYPSDNPSKRNLILSGKITPLNLAFQFKYVDTTGEGCYIWANAMQLTDSNNRTLGKIRDAFQNWKNSILEDSTIMEKLNQAKERQ